MSKKVRNSARRISTTFGGVDWVPSATRSSDSTTTMRTKEVTITRMDGASVMTVSRTTSWTMRPVAEPPSPKRSEEHTSDLQSLIRISYAVFCLKKKKYKKTCIKS